MDQLQSSLSKYAKGVDARRVLVATNERSPEAIEYLRAANYSLLSDHHTAIAQHLKPTNLLLLDALVLELLTALDANTTVLVKGSRSSAMERVVHQLVE